VATYSTVLGLKLNDESDPFQLSDFIQNWQTLDASPGIYICTSTSRPSWGTSQAGRLIFMTDLKQVSYWSGTTWNDLRDAAPMFAGGFYLNVSCNPGSTGTFNLLTLTTPRPSSLAIWAGTTYTYAANGWQNASQAITFDGTASLMGSFQEQVRFAGDPYSTGGTGATNATSMTMIPTCTAGQHQIGLRVQVSNNYFTSVNLVGVKVLALISTYASGNSL
jgi:hypothetical protein